MQTYRPTCKLHINNYLVLNSAFSVFPAYMPSGLSYYINVSVYMMKGPLGAKSLFATVVTLKIL